MLAGFGNVCREYIVLLHAYDTCGLIVGSEQMPLFRGRIIHCDFMCDYSVSQLLSIFSTSGRMQWVRCARKRILSLDSFQTDNGGRHSNVQGGQPYHLRVCLCCSIQAGRARWDLATVCGIMEFQIQLNLKRDFGNRSAGHLDCLWLKGYRFDCIIIEMLASRQCLFHGVLSRD